MIKKGDLVRVSGAVSLLCTDGAEEDSYEYIIEQVTPHIFKVSHSGAVHVYFLKKFIKNNLTYFIIGDKIPVGEDRWKGIW